uniref:NB-ARC domain-containing protein n=1 Tax=Panagrolaimus superbus TaxID=310955 RepID=A0A914XX82_9BILA
MEYNKFIDNILNRGCVPPPLRHAVPRMHLMDTLAEKIKIIANEDQKNWLVIHGPPGVGKTRLVVDTLRTKPEFAGHYFDRIFWITDYCTNAKALSTVFSDLLIAITTPTYEKLMQIVQINHERAIQELIAEELRANPKTLLIVDGVFLPKCINFFASFQCPIIFTTCFTDIFNQSSNRLSADHGFFNFGIREEFTDEEMKQLAKSYDFSLTNYQISNLRYNSGSNPAVLGKLLESAQVEQQMLTVFADSEAQRPFENYDYPSSYYFRSMTEPINLLFEFVFRLIWPIDLCGNETENEIIACIMKDVSELIHKSLLEKNRQTEKSFHSHLIHPIIHSYLVRKCLKENPKELMVRSITASLELLQTRLRHDIGIPVDKSEAQLRREVLRDFYEKNERYFENLSKKSTEVLCNRSFTAPLISSETSWKNWIKHWLFWFI